MSHTPHDLAEDFPGQSALISDLKGRDAHFARLAEQYHDTNRAIHRAETGIEPVSDEHETALRRERMRLKDEIARALRAAEAAQ